MVIGFLTDSRSDPLTQCQCKSFWVFRWAFLFHDPQNKKLKKVLTTSNISCVGTLQEALITQLTNPTTFIFWKLFCFCHQDVMIINKNDTKLPFLCRLFCKDNLHSSEPSLDPNGQNVNLSRVGTRIHDVGIGTWTWQQAHPLYYRLHCKMWIITISQLVLKFCLGLHFENVCIQVALCWCCSLQMA